MKKFKSICACCLILTLVAGCGKNVKLSDNTTSSKKDAGQQSSTQEVTTKKQNNLEDSTKSTKSTDATKATESTKNVTKAAPDFDMKNTVFSKAGEFSEGLAWVQYRGSDNKFIVALVDRDGYMRCSYSDLGYNSTAYASPVTDGLSFVRFGNVANSDFVNSGYEVIVDSKGNELYRTIQENYSTGSKREHIVAYGNGKFLMYRITSGIEGNKYMIGVIDKYGKDINEFVEMELQRAVVSPSDDWTDFYDTCYMGEDCFIFQQNDRSYIYDASANKILSSSNGTETIVGMKDGKYFYNSKQVGLGYSHLGIANVRENVEEKNGSTHAKYTQIDYPEGYNRSKNKLCDLDGTQLFGDGEVYYCHGYYDVDGNRTISIPIYEDLKMWCSTFSDEGYALMVLCGADNYNYVTVIDRSGAQQFEPFRIKYDKNSYSNLVNISSHIENGKFICQTDDGLCIFDAKTGTKLDTIAKSTNSRNICVYAFGDGYALYETDTGRKYYFFE